MAERRKHRAILLILLFLIPFAVYSGNLAGGFVYDDNVQVLENVWIRDIRHLPDIFLSSGWSYLKDRSGSNFYRPTIHLLLMAEYHLFGLKPWGYHLVNNILHSINALLVFVLAARLMTGGRVRGAGVNSGPATGLITPFFAGLIFALHPVNSEVVSWVAAIPELLYAMFLLLAFYLYVRSKEGGGLLSGMSANAVSVVCFIMALLSKETAMVLLIMIPAYEFSTGEGPFIRRVFSCWKRYLPYLVAASIYMAVRTRALGGVIPHKGMDLSAYESLLNVFPLIARYLGKLILPVGLSAIYSPHVVNSITEPVVVLGIVVALVFAILLLRTDKTFRFALLWILMPLLPVLYLPAISKGGFADRYLYLPSFGFAVIVASGFEWVLARGGGSGARGLSGLNGQGRAKALFTVVTALGAGLLVLYSIGSVKRSMVWRDDYSLWTDASQKSPESDRAHYNLGWKLQKMGEGERAIKEYKEAIRLNPDKVEAHSNIAMLYGSRGDNINAIRHYREVIRIKPGSPTAYYDVAIIYQSIGSRTETVALYKEAIRLNPAYEDAHYNLGWTYQSLGDYADAAAEYNEVIRLNPESADAHYNLGLVYVRLGMRDKAAVHFKTVMDIAPGYLGARERLEKLTAPIPQGKTR